MNKLVLLTLAWTSYGIPTAIFYLLRTDVRDKTAFAGSTIALALLAWRYLTTGKVSRYPLARNKWLVGWLIVGTYVGALGILNNFSRWIYSDIYRYLIVPVLVLGLLGTRSSVLLEWYVTQVVRMELLVACIKVLTVLTGAFPNTGNTLSLAAVFALAMLLTGDQGVKRWLIPALIILADLLLSSSGTLLIEMALLTVLLPLALLRARAERTRVGVRTIRAYVVLGLVLTSLLALEPAKAQVTASWSRVLALWNYEKDLSLHGRLAEASVAYRELQAAGPTRTLVGMGAGGTYYLPDVMTWAGSERYIATEFQIHNIHIGPVSVLYRTGLVGLLVLYVPMVAVPLNILAKRKRSTAHTVVALFAILKAVESLQALRVVGDPVALFLLAAAATQVDADAGAIPEGGGACSREPAH